MTMRVFRTAVLTGLAAVAVLILAVPADAAAVPASDTTPPAVSIEPFARYVAGTSADTVYGPDGLEGWDLDMMVRWTASDASGICGQTLTEQSYDTLGGDPDPILGSDTTTTSVPRGVRSHSYAEDAQNYWRIPHSFVVRVTDCAGNTAASGIATTSVNVDDDDSPIIAYAGAWAVGHFPGFSGGTTHYATAAGASASFPVDEGAVAVVMEKAANRGSARIFVDGALKATVNTNSATTQHRRVVWQALLGPGPHTVMVVNSGSTGHPRIDLDAVLD
jgi:hypothetical protein